MKSLTVLLFCLAAWSLGAATYYVTTGGNDSSDGSIGTPWLTVQKACNTVAAGDTVNVAAGNYNSTNYITTSGTSVSRITFVGTSLPTLNYFSLVGNYVTVQGFNLAGPGSAGSGDCSIKASGNSNEVSGCTWTNTTWIRGVELSGTGNTLTNCYFTSPTLIANADLRVGFQLTGGGHLVTRNTFDSITDPESFGLVWGTNQVIEFNTMTNCTNPGYTTPGTHADFLQTWNLSGSTWSSNIVVNGNRIVDSSTQCFMLNAANTGQGTSPNIRNWYVHNNVFANSVQSGSCYVPFVEIANNVFTNWGTANGYSFYIRLGTGDPYGFGTNCTVYNNAFTDTTYARETTVTADYNQKNTASLPADGGTHNVYAAPGFTGAQNFLLTAGSALIGAGTVLSTFALDADGITRGVTWDIGAYEYAAPAGNTATVQTLNVGTLRIGP